MYPFGNVLNNLYGEALIALMTARDILWWWSSFFRAVRDTARRLRKLPVWSDITAPDHRVTFFSYRRCNVRRPFINNKHDDLCELQALE